MSLTVRIKGLEEARTRIARARAELVPRFSEELRKGGDMVRDAAAASAGGGRLSANYKTEAAGTTVVVANDLIYAPVQEFAVVWGRDVTSKKTGRTFHQTVHYRDAAVPRHLIPAFRANREAVAIRVEEGVARLLGEIFGGA